MNVVMPDFSYDKGDDGTMDNNAGRLKQPSSSPSLLESTIAAEEISRNLCVTLLESCWTWFCVFLLLNVLYKAMKEHVILMAVCHQGIPTLPMEKKQFDVNRNTLFRLTAEIHLDQIQQQ